MKKILLLLSVVILLFGCSSEDDNNNNSNLEITVDPFTASGVTIHWTYSGTGNVVYRILFEGEIIEEAYTGTQYTFPITQPGNYEGIVFAISQNNEETFESFSFSTSGSNIWFGDLTISTEEEYQDFNYSIVTGKLSIRNLGDHDLSNISSLTSVKGISIRDSQINSLHGLENIEEFGYYGLKIINNDNLSSICCLNGIQNIDSDGILIVDNDILTSIEGFPALQSINNLKLMNNPELSDLSGFSGLESINDLFYLENVPSLETLNDLGNLHSIGTFRIMPNSVTHLTGLNSVLFIENLIIDNNDALISVNLSGVERMSGIYINGNEQLQTFELPNLNQLEGGSIYVNNNASLTQIDFGNPSLVNSNLDIQFSSMPNFNSIEGLQSVTEIANLYLINLPSLTNLSGFIGLETVNYQLRLENLQGLTSLQGLNNLVSVATGTSGGVLSKFQIIDVDNITSLSGLDKLETLGWLWISGNTGLTNLDGTILHQSIPDGSIMHIFANPNLSDFCGLTTFVNEGDVVATINSNAYNPTVQQIASSTECSF